VTPFLYMLFGFVLGCLLTYIIVREP